MISYGTGTPLAKCFDQYEVIDIINQIIKFRKVVCFEAVGSNPLLDARWPKPLFRFWIKLHLRLFTYRIIFFLFKYKIPKSSNIFWAFFLGICH
jgi:hypothetical protein